MVAKWATIQHVNSFLADHHCKLFCVNFTNIFFIFLPALKKKKKKKILGKIPRLFESQSYHMMAISKHEKKKACDKDGKEKKNINHIGNCGAR